MEKICFICNRYPTVISPTRQVFVKKLVWALADMGMDCTVISPVPVNQYLSTFSKLPTESSERTDNGNVVKLYFPRYISAGQKNIFGFTTSGITTDLFHRAVRKVWKSKMAGTDIVYGHFLTPAGITASRIAKEFNIAGFAAFGESTAWSIINYGKDKMKQEIANLKGIVSVSTANQKLLAELDIFPADRVRVFPNGIQGKHFYPRNKKLAREKFGFDKDKFLVAYVGQFSDRKGVMRVAEALGDLNDVDVAFAGKGKLEPTNKNCVHKTSVKPDDIPFFLSAADVFVLPTLNEGCSNAVIEAMSCGLPVVSSNLPFNDDILDDTNAMLIDPNNIDEIRNATIYLKDNPAIREQKRTSAINMSKILTIEARAQNIYTFMKEMM